MRCCMHPLFSGGLARRCGWIGYVCRERRIDGVGGGASRWRLCRFDGNGFARCVGQRSQSAIGFFLQRSIQSRASRAAVCGLGSGGRCRSMGAWDCGFRLPSVWGCSYSACRGGRDGGDARKGGFSGEATEVDFAEVRGGVGQSALHRIELASTDGDEVEFFSTCAAGDRIRIVFYPRTETLVTAEPL